MKEITLIHAQQEIQSSSTNSVALNAEDKDSVCRSSRNCGTLLRVLTSNWKNRIVRQIFISVAVLALLGAQMVSAGTNVSGPITTDTTWSWANSPYVVTNNVTVNSGVTLTVEPGVIVKFNPTKGLTVKGRIVANGTSTARIAFTSIEDDSIGGDTGGDGPTVGAKGDWAGITISTATSGAGSEMSFVDIAYAGQYFAALFAFNSYSNLSFDNSTVSNSGFYGIASQSKQSATNGFVLTMSSSSVSDSARIGLLIAETAAIVTGSTFTGNGYEGIKIELSSYFVGTGSSITSSDVYGNRKAGIALYVDPNLPSIRKPNGHFNNIYANNYYGAPYLHHGVQLFSGKQHDDSDWSENYWGENTGSRSCDPKYNFLYRRHQVIYTDVTFTTLVNGSSLGLPGVVGCTRDTVFTENPAITPYD